MADQADAPPLSQLSADFPLEPVTGKTLFLQDRARRNRLHGLGGCRTGCAELDDEVLLGGFERGRVVGVSAEEDDVGVLLGLQTVAHLLAAAVAGGGSGGDGGVAAGREGRRRPRAVVVTTLAVGELVPLLRDVVRTQIRLVRPGGGAGAKDDEAGLVTACLERVSISRVFDFEGLWEVLGELDLGASTSVAPAASSEREEADEQQVETAPSGGVVTTEDVSMQGASMEIGDSEDEGGLSSPESTPITKDPTTAINPKDSDTSSQQQNDSALPDIIFITHMSSILSTLFTRREKDTAHTMLQQLSIHLRYLTRSTAEHDAAPPPLVLIANSTTTASPPAPGRDSSSNSKQNDPSAAGGPPRRQGDEDNADGGGPRRTNGRPLDPTLRSVFNPPPLAASGLPYSHGTPLSRRNKPSFGLVFSQLLDLHLLATRVPRSRADAEAVFLPPEEAAAAAVASATTRREGDGVGAAAAAGGGGIRYAWAVEVLMDEVGVWDPEEAREGGKGRRSRERRWGAVDVLGLVGRGKGGGGRNGDVRIVDAFERRERVPVGEVRTAGGFGGLIL
ncbi:uncharacterized protein E0L32_008394 [Thyridium curvatum]|uniref:Uncharacterized protein n=1 Tax=Thyridium curvatum TaxID=1093900 RepID=A0A507B284_9PEZI|nr:uncharacterized protein E0L32_008394 [Thyridium curvatum]TPX10660.1 hypothetical protein E0L32_008394 [Thyridium curvatum]